MKKKEKKNGKKKNESEGFTFVETIIVLAIVAILTAGTTVSAGRLISTAKRVSAKNQIEQYSSALQTYFLDCVRFPTTEQGLKALWEKTDLYPIPENWNGPYLEKEPAKDPWGADYKYISRESSVMPLQVPDGLPFVLLSYGADGQEGGEKDNEDIVSWK